MSLRLHPKPGQEVQHRTASLVNNADELGADLEQEHERADDDKRDPVAQSRVRNGRLDDRARAEERRNRVNDQYRFAVTEAELLQTVMQMAFIRFENRLALLPTADDGEERIGQRYADNQQRRYERHDRNLLEPKHRQRRQREAEEQSPGVAHENFRRVEVEEQESPDAAEQQSGQQNNRLVAHDNAHHENGGNGDPRHACGQAVQTVDQVDRVRHADDPHDGDRDADPFSQRLHRRAERNVQQVDLDSETEDDDASRADLHEQLQLGVQVVFIVKRAQQHDQSAAHQQRANEIAVVSAQIALRNERHHAEQTDGERRINPYSPQARHRPGVNLAMIRHVDRADAVSELLDQRRQHDRQSHCRNE